MVFTINIINLYCDQLIGNSSLLFTRGEHHSPSGVKVERPAQIFIALWKMVGFTAWANATYRLRCKAAVSERLTAASMRKQENL